MSCAIWIAAAESGEKDMQCSISSFGETAEKEERRAQDIGLLFQSFGSVIRPSDSLLNLGSKECDAERRN
jgi:hypothetical protein